MIIRTSLLGLFFLIQAAAFGQVLEARFEVLYSGASVTGVFSETSVDYRFETDDLENSYFNATIQVVSMDTEMPARDTQLMKKKYFHADKYPTMTFKSNRIYRQGVSYFVEGDLTIKDVTTKMQLPLQVSFNQSGISVLKTEFTIDRRDYHIGKSHFLLEDEVSIWIELKP